MVNSEFGSNFWTKMSDSDDSDAPDGQMENGHVPYDASDQPSERSPRPRSNSDQFDLDLPTSHRYLGKLDNITGYTFFDDGEIITLAALQTNTLVFPGFTLPLVMDSDVEVAMLQRFTSKKNAFVLLTPNADFNGVFPYGVIMEIVERHVRNGKMKMKARSRQRCRLVPGTEVSNLPGDLKQVTVRAMLEPVLTSPIANTQLASLKLRRKWTSSDIFVFASCRKYRKYHLSQYPMASWVYDKHEIGVLSHRLRTILTRRYGNETRIIPEDPVALSYWTVQNYTLTHEERLRIMAMDSALERIRLEIMLVKMKRLICCTNCGSEIADLKHVFAMSKDGVQSNYCNPNGYVFETITVSTVNNVSLVGLPSAQFSWFPGYLWTILQCRICSAHLGWKFTSASMKPDHFFGLARSGYRIKFVDDPE